MIGPAAGNIDFSAVFYVYLVACLAVIFFMSVFYLMRWRIYEVPGMWIVDCQPEEFQQVDIWVQMPDGNGQRVPDVMRSGNDYLMFCTLGANAPKVPYSRYLIEQGATVTAWMPVPMPPQQG